MAKKMCAEMCPYTRGHHDAVVAVMSAKGIPEKIRRKLNVILIAAYRTDNKHK